MKIYIYDVNYKNEFLMSLDVESMTGYEDVATTIEPVECTEVGKSYAFNPKTQAWDTLIEDWRGVKLYSIFDSRNTQVSHNCTKSSNYIEIAPPDTEKQYKYTNNTWTEYVVPVADQLKQYENAVQNKIDQVAQARGYDNGYTCASYYEDPCERFANDAKTFKDWRSAVWVQVNELLNKYKAGELTTIPTVEEVVANLPTITWLDE